MKISIYHGRQINQLIGIANIAILCLLPNLSQAATRYVATTGSNVGACTLNASACATISYAAMQAGVGDTIEVAAGSYMEAVSITKTLTIKGAKASLDARTRTVVPQQESTISGIASGMSVNADSVVIDGFIFSGNAVGIAVASNVSGTVIDNNVITGAGNGITLGSNGVAQTKVRRNLLNANNLNGSGNGNAITAGQPLSNALIADNRISNNSNAGILLTAINAGPISNIVISGNELFGNALGVALFKTSNVTISDNNMHDQSFHAVQLAGNNGVTVTGNQLTNSVNAAVRIGDAFGSGPNSNLTIVGNQITGNQWGVRMTANGSTNPVLVEGNRIVGNSLGLQNLDSQTINGANNWFGCAAGPGNAGCDATTSGVTIPTWYKLAAKVSSASIYADDSVVVQAFFVTSNGAPANAANQLKSGQVNFAAVGGVFASASAPFVSGIAQSQFTSSTAGTASITVSLDAAMITLDISISEPPPLPPANLACTPASRSLTCTFSPAYQRNGESVQGYNLFCLSNISQSGLLVSAGSSPISQTGLVNGVTYRCQVSAYGSAGASSFSSLVEVTPFVPLAANQQIDVLGRGLAQVYVRILTGSGDASIGQLGANNRFVFTPVNDVGRE